MLRRAVSLRALASCAGPRTLPSGVSRERLDNYGQPMHHTHPHHIPGPDYGARAWRSTFCALARSHSDCARSRSLAVLYQGGSVTRAMCSYHVSRAHTVKAAHAARRDRLLSLVSGEAKTKSLAFLQFSAGAHVTMTNDIPYRWRQQSDFLYLTGFEEGDSALLMVRVGQLFPYDRCTDGLVFFFWRRRFGQVVSAATRCWYARAMRPASCGTAHAPVWSACRVHLALLAPALMCCSNVCLKRRTRTTPWSWALCRQRTRRRARLWMPFARRIRR